MVFQNMVLRIFGPMREEVTEEWRRLHNEELNDLYSSPNTVRVIKSRRMRWAGHVGGYGRYKHFKKKICLHLIPGSFGTNGTVHITYVGGNGLAEILYRILHTEHTHTRTLADVYGKGKTYIWN